jgi:hypothetical protein
MEDIGGKWIWVVLLIAYYLYSAYAANKKKQEEANKKQQQNTETSPKRHHNPTPTSQPLPPMGDIFREIFGKENFPAPKPKPKPAEIKRKQPTLKQVAKEKKNIPSTVTFKEGETAISSDQMEIQKQESEAYNISQPSAKSHSFNAREAFIGSVIFNRPEY